jgi:hypothetical protein
MTVPDYYQELKKHIGDRDFPPNYTEDIFLSYNENRLSLVREIKDEEVLKIVFENETEWTIRLSALVNIKDEDYLKKIVRSNLDISFKKDCLDRIHDQEFLRDTCYLYLKEDHSDILIYLINKIIVKSFLEDLKKTLIKKRVVDGRIFSAIRDQIEECKNSISYMFD